MPTPRDAAKKHGAKLTGTLAGEPRHCGACGLPSAECRCSSQKQWGADATSASPSDPGAFPAKSLRGSKGG